MTGHVIEITPTSRMLSRSLIARDAYITITGKQTRGDYVLSE